MIIPIHYQEMTCFWFAFLLQECLLTCSAWALVLLLINCYIILITYIYLLVGYNFSCLIGGGCGVGLGLGWGFGNAYGCQYRSSRVQFQGIEFQKKAEGDDAPKVVSPDVAEKSRPYG